jgi:DNA-binding NarL/FixJ family response regulator
LVSVEPYEEAALSGLPRCLVVDGHLLARLGAGALLADRYEVEATCTRREAVELVETVGGMDLALVDMRPAPNGDLTGVETIAGMHRVEPTMGLVALGECPHRHLASSALQAGARAYVTKGAAEDHLLEALDAALASEDWVDPAVPPRGSRGILTRRQRQILQRLADGQSTTNAAKELDLSEETVKTHMKNILARLEARNRAHAVAIGLRDGLIE